MKPIVHGLENDYWKRVKFTYLDMDDAATSELLKAVNFRFRPHFTLLDGQGAIVKQWAGIVTADEFKQAFDALLASS